MTLRAWTSSGVFVLSLLLAACGDGGDPGGGPAKDATAPRTSPATWNLAALPKPGPTLREETTPAGTIVRVLAEGTGEAPKPGEILDVRFRGFLLSGSTFDEGLLVSRTGEAIRGNPPGVDEGLAGMRVGERRRVLVPNLPGWRQAPAASIPPYTPVVLDVERIPTIEVAKLDVKDGTGDAARLGSTITAHYKGTLSGGKVFESSFDQKKPITGRLAPGSLIEGWLRGIPGMKEGGVRMLRIPADLAYGRAGNPPKIPPNAELTFEIELIDVK